jgi:competence protein ComEC
MLPRPAWLAVGVIAAAGASSYAPVGGAAVSEVAVAAGVATALAVSGCACEAAGRRKGARILAIAALGAALVAGRLAAGIALSGAGSAGLMPLPTGTGTWQATVESAHTTRGQQVATIDVADPPLRCSALMPAYPRLAYGDVVSWAGRVRALTDSDYDRYLDAQGIAATCDAASLTLLRHDDSPAGKLEALRQASGDALQLVIPEPEGGLAAAILIGLRDRVDKGVAAAFTTSGVSHIVAISGWNIAIVAATVAALLRSRISRRRHAIVTILAIVAYTLFAGATPSVNRAALMAGVALLAVESGRGSRVIVGLAWAVTMLLLLEPATAADVGFQLSAAATAGLVAWGPPLSQRLEARWPGIPASIRESLGVSLAAQAATLPIALLTFGRLAMVAPLANLVAVPLVPPAMAAGGVAFLAGLLATLGAPLWLTGLLAMPAWFFLATLVAVVQLAASIPGANETLPFPANAMGAFVAGLLLWRMHWALKKPRSRAEARSAARSPLPHRRVGPATRARPRRKWARAGAAILLVLAGSVVASRPDGRIHVIVLDVGQGDSILLEGDRGGRILVDGGPDAAVLMTQLDRYVPAWDRRIDAIVLTHPHDDHVSGLVAVVDRYRVGRAFESGWPASTPAYGAWLDALDRHGLRPERLKTGDRLLLDDATLRVLWPDDGRTRPSGLDPTAADNRKANDASIVLLGEFQDRRFLLTGDAEDDVDPVLLARGLPHVDMLKVAHRGSGTASSDELLGAVRPDVAVISVGAGNTYGHPAAATIERLRAHAGRVLRTDQAGTVETTIDAVNVIATSDRAAAASSMPPTSSAVRARSTAPEDPAQPGAALVAAGASASRALLYDSRDVRTEPSRQRGLVPLSRAAGVAPSPLEGRSRGCRLAGVAGGFRWAIA